MDHATGLQEQNERPMGKGRKIWATKYVTISLWHIDEIKYLCIHTDINDKNEVYYDL
jgi:hypothetical protein